MATSVTTLGGTGTRLRLCAFSGALALNACAHQEDTGPAAPQAPGTPTPVASIIVEPPPAAATAAAPPALTGPQEPQVDPPLMLKDAGFKTPESVLYDPEEDEYLVSNVNGKPTDVDGNGFISKVAPDGKVIDLKWIDGSKKATALNAPKGLTIAGSLLYVADLTYVRMFDKKTGAPRGKIAIPGATFLNDVATGPDGSVYVSDTGLKAGKEGLEPTGSDSIYKIVKGARAIKVVADRELGGPNGLTVDDKGVWVATFRTGEIYRIEADGKKHAVQKLPEGSLDGIVKLSDGTMLVSSWAASAIYRGRPGGTFEAVVHDMKSPADIGYDSKRNVVLIPLFQLNTVALQRLPGAEPPAAAVAPAAAPGTGAPTSGSVSQKQAVEGPPAAPSAAAVSTAMTPGSKAAGTPKAPVKAPVAPAPKK